MGRADNHTQRYLQNQLTSAVMQKHAQFVIENQAQIDESIQTRTPLHIESEEFYADIDVELNGRLLGLISQL